MEKYYLHNKEYLIILSKIRLFNGLNIKKLSRSLKT